MGLLLLTTSVACATEPAAVQADSLDTASKGAIGKNLTIKQKIDDKREPVSGFKFDGKIIIADVISHGCTQSDDFRIDHVVSENQCNLTITRVKPDLCRRAPLLQTIELEWQAPTDCQLIPIVVLNPVLVAPESGLLSKRLK